ncbi:MAG: serine/threonine protein kinase [Planctomycetes bacterium]|nr:serine/threonine protein kinase [Planctomycetota bacterium]
MDDRLDAVFDEYLDRALRGDAQDVDVVLREHPELNSDERRRVRAMAAAVAGDDFAGGASDLPADEGLPVARLGEFRLVRLLGEGSMGAVYLAEQTTLRRLVALKVIQPDRAGSPDAVARLHREAQSIAKLRHPNIVTVFATGEENGIHYIAMDLVPGKGLDQILVESVASGIRPPIPQVLRWMADVARALQCAHDAGIIHRDVKPSNVRITPEGKAMLVDFGLVLEMPNSSATITSRFRGTPHYASPEQIASDRIGVDPRADVYSLGVVLYECVTGVVPFEGDPSVRVIEQILVKEPVPPRRLNPEIPRDLETVIQHAMEKDRERRYPTARAVADELEAVLALRPIVAKPANLLTRASKWTRRNRAAAAAIGVALIVAVVGFLLSLHTTVIVDELRAAHNRRAEQVAAIANLESRLSDLQTQPVTPVTTTELRRFERRLHEARLGCEAASIAIVAWSGGTSSRDPQAVAVRHALADFAMERFRDAVREGDRVAERFWAGEARATDTDGRSTPELDGLGTLSLTSDPNGAEVYLLREIEEWEVLDEGSTRRVHLPLHEATPVPLAANPKCFVGSAPIKRRWLPRGSYVAIVRLEGYREESLPFVVAYGRDTALTVTLKPGESSRDVNR